MRELSAIGIDTAKYVFHLVGVTKEGKVVYRKKVSRRQLLEEVTRQGRCRIFMEACGGSHYWGRAFQERGHEVKLIAPQFVKPYVKSNKNDWMDAEAIVEAGQRPTMRFVGVKTVAQQELQLMHRCRERVVKATTAMANEIRGLLLEFGITIPKGAKNLREIPALLEKYSGKMTSLGRELIMKALEDYRRLAEQVAQYDVKLERLTKEHPVCQRLMTIPGVGPIIASAIVAAVSDPAIFRNGRQFAAWLGLVPRQESSGGKPRLLGISKRGDVYIRKQLVHGARSVLYNAHKKTDRRSVWATAVKNRRGWNKAAVAMANKNARVIWAILRYETNYQTQPAQSMAA